jgi:hypothetical protein
MEARDLGNTITLYLPQGGTGAEAYTVLQERERVGGFASRAESVQFALALALTLHRSRNVPVRMRVEDDSGNWQTTDALAGALPDAGV